MELELVFPEKHHCDLWRDIVDEIESAGEEMAPYALTLGVKDFEEYLDKTIAFSAGLNLPIGLVPSTTYFLMEKGGARILGAVNIRHRLNDSLLRRGGHIGYGVRPSERRKNYATAMLAGALEKCREMGLNRVLLTCDKTNTGSVRVIVKNGGVFENEYVDEGGCTVQRYWITL